MRNIVSILYSFDMKFYLDESFLMCVTITKEWGIFDHQDNLTNEELVKVLRGEDRCSSISSEDHPEFAKFRNQLEADGYIRTERRWHNGDVVIKRFILNDVEFGIGDKFPCGSAMKIHLDVERKYGRSV